PDTLTLEQTESMLGYFNELCSICDNRYEHLDHFIPLYTECGGTTKENIIPLCARCNLSKNRKNPYEWSLDLNNREKKNFDKVVSYLAQVNAMDGKTYKDYVYKCFKYKGALRR